MFQSLYQEITYNDPFLDFSSFANQKGSIFLDSASSSHHKWPSGTGRYSFWSFDPVYTLTSKNGKIDFKGHAFEGNPFDVLQKSLTEFKCTNHPNLPPWQGGIAGYFAYDLCHHLEKLPRPSQDDVGTKDLVLGYYDVVVAYDHEDKKAWIISTGYPETEEPKRLQKAQERLDAFVTFIQKAEPVSMTPPPALSSLTCNFTPETYQQTVQKVIDYIYAGDVFQTNLSRRISGDLPEGYDLLALYQKLRSENPAPFSAYFNAAPTYLLSSSPERFLKSDQGKIEARPIKGTRKRSADPLEDAKLARELMDSEKDQAENVMIVDLMRNDLSKVCELFSVQVPSLLELESYATVHHLVSTVTGILKPELDNIDLLKATFPGGSITGAPKIRAMEIIAELEPSQRGPYCGSIGYIGFNGNMDVNIAIRTLTAQENKICFQVGGGIVADSNPFEEYIETETKAAALIKILTK
ncbi:MAG: aminodeoxychorismate synthase component I [Alphaproteobacteria bacterium]|nr:aminodeoxychorismate synthase component I [Alphaproteobacteria bacterium]